MKLLDSFNKKHLGMGIVLFEKVLLIDNYEYISYIEKLKSDAIKKDYTIICDSQQMPIYAINRSGHRYEIEDISKSASHITDFVDEKTPESVKSLFELCEKAMAQCLLEYIEEFPMVLPSIWWRTYGHILAYGPGSQMGLHSDNDVNYQPGFEPDLQLATRNVVGSIVYLNSSSSLEPVEKNSYLGGEIEFPYANVKYSPQIGDVLMFPSSYLGAHKIHECKKGNRYAYIGYYCQGSADPKRGIDIKDYEIPVGFQGQAWMKNLVVDYIRHVEGKYPNNKKAEDLLIPTKRKHNSSNTLEEVNRARQ